MSSSMDGQAHEKGGDGGSGDETERKPGPEPERLKLPHEDWEDAVREALEVEQKQGEDGRAGKED